MKIIIYGEQNDDKHLKPHNDLTINSISLPIYS